MTILDLKRKTCENSRQIHIKTILSILGALTLVGNLELIDEPLTAFVRLEEGILMPNALEIPIPVRFIFLLLTPKSDLTIGMM